MSSDEEMPAHRQQSCVGILVGGGPAPGINSVISAATLRCGQAGVEVLGIHQGFQRLMEGDLECASPLRRDDVTRIHFQGGSHLGTSRANPTRDPGQLRTVVESLARLGIERLITIGGDDTCFSALSVARAAGGRLRVVHVPKTIDNDLDLPQGGPTFGFQTARHVGVDLVKNLLVDAHTSGHWYFIVAMGRKAGHLALGIGKAAGATLTLIPEEFGGKGVAQTRLADILVGSIIKQRWLGNGLGGVAILAEGLSEILAHDHDEGSRTVERDPHGHVRLEDMNLGDRLRREVGTRLAECNVRATIVPKNIGYELRCADPIPFDMEYARDLGYGAAQYLLEGGTAAMVTLSKGRFEPIPFQELLDPVTGRTRVRVVDVHSTSYEVARQYMTRLQVEDFRDEATVAAMAALTNLPPEAFRKRFQPVVSEHEAS